MAAVTRTQLCDLCHLKPKFGDHQHCSATSCARKAAALCNNSATNYNYQHAGASAGSCPACLPVATNPQQQRAGGGPARLPVATNPQQQQQRAGGGPARLPVATNPQQHVVGAQLACQ
ncbi:hypothetical protein AGABI1DRAFT_129180 [Agaricus bisporus var. burnettii JB137-S8]|uniref:Uncharacterized protein n=1 Tax=Agaricus bisporus var. burnettii (strain JB137-S8 / ATCC MYA-4627 / FGSC 10392) TaxID=597362 RepID=K5X6R3_AGABU|nr:uncharacterized protein AGABI1DRAFT_129180 [Agaricus bisporus var. burnettii JB137-S8]EKM78908.1 hypothetical protein AGABI1DRAFT_129180 [Agaricus bisporus var. burnettii JB137-S8]